MSLRVSIPTGQQIYVVIRHNSRNPLPMSISSLCITQLLSHVEGRGNTDVAYTCNFPLVTQTHVLSCHAPKDRDGEYTDC